ncbi:germination protein YpeB [Hazenella sp. IB182357]|uniref:Germination protein YpeB n=1 Tax=Polycladospora coralii TaxID=2771432 RepID=A0A926NAH5_9BACL|nr:germination protein YpeB [Polycladospora coralii]MBD1371645.1 germination protein YpeB [Polycladospora coralii]MBS7529112.1 germination protein YpeB [Polycladospora coralii]
MYKRIAAVLFPVTLIALVATATWGYQENQDKNSILIKAESQYQRAFHELNANVDQLQDELGKSLALNSRNQMSSSLSNVWRISYSAQSNIGQLPLTLMPFDSAEKFVAKTGKFAYEIGLRDLDKQPLTDDEWKTLEGLYQNADDIRKDLQSVQKKVMDKDLRWMDVEMALASEDQKMDNVIIDGFKEVNHKVEQYPEIDWGPTISNMEVRKKEKNNRLTGPTITADDAKKVVAKMVDRKTTDGMNTKKSVKGDFPTWNINYKESKIGDVYANVTVKGGHPVWFLYDRPVTVSKISYEEALRKAKRFLIKSGFKHMEAISYDETENVIAYNFVQKTNGVMVYPKTVVAKVALDNGDIMGLQTDEYVFNPLDVSKMKAKLSEKDAKKQVNQHLKIQKVNRAVIYDRQGEARLCYEFQGILKNSLYRVFIDANTGDEVEVKKVKQADADLA